MSTTRDDGGPAFPAGTYCNNFGDEVPMRGMSLRDWFAGQALAGLLSRDLEGNGLGNHHINHAQVKGKADPAWVAMQSYAIADAMLYERKDGEP